MTQKKEYRSAIRSRRLIRTAFQELLAEKPFEKITVTDIVNRADINRSTFYAHYPDVRGLVDDILQETVDASIAVVSNLNYRDIFNDPTPLLDNLLQVGMEYVSIYKLISNTDFALKMMEQVKTVFLKKALEAVDIPLEIRESSAFRIQINFFIGGILNTYQQWMNGFLDCSPEEIMNEIARLIVNSKEMYRNWL